ncbi:hypothetical protein RUM44_012215 [Polyplax serrata]|uniref:Uncharacterized protein n=1 Tax=Polyplax serrata TaxID=468196 RepID=A0ABR1BF31_POLSC
MKRLRKVVERVSKERFKGQERCSEVEERRLLNSVNDFKMESRGSSANYLIWFPGPGVLGLPCFLLHLSSQEIQFLLSFHICSLSLNQGQVIESAKSTEGNSGREGASHPRYPVTRSPVGRLFLLCAVRYLSVYRRFLRHSKETGILEELEVMDYEV